MGPAVASTIYILFSVISILLSFILLTLFVYPLGYFLLYLSILLNRLIWPFLRGIIRAFYEHEIIKKKKLLFYIGLLLLYFTLFPKLNIEGIWKIVEKLL